MHNINYQINNDANIESTYQNILKQLEYLLNKNDNLISNLSNLAALLKLSLKKASWVGFYIKDDNKIFLGPFQGKPACVNIDLGKGVCGTAALKKETIIVPDVNNFEGHIACDSESRSEIVVPIIKNKELYGVLDVDSTSLNAFDQTDKKYLEEICTYFSNNIL